MSEQRDHFIAMLRKNPDDMDTPLVFADWLEDHDEKEQADFMRLQCQAAGFDRTDQSPEAKEAYSLNYQATKARAKALHAQLDLPGFGDGYRFERGFLVHALLPVQWLLKAAPKLREVAPLLRKLTVGCVHGFGKQLAACPLLEQIADLEIQAWVTSSDAESIADSPHLKKLRALEIWLGAREGSNQLTLQAFAEGTTRAYPNLEELRIVDDPGCSVETLERANEHAGRTIAKAVLPAPRLYPVEADFTLYSFAGHYPDGTQVFGCTPNRDETTATLYYFAPDGVPTEIQNYELPADVHERRPDDGYHDLRDRIKAHLTRELNFKPGLIRIQGFHENADDGPAPYPYHVEDYLGYLDDPNGLPENDMEDPMGNASRCAYWLKFGTYVFYLRGGDPFVNSDGQVEST